MEQGYKYFAFISYNYKDTKWGKRLQRKLEGYRLPATLCSQHGLSRHPIKPVFFAPTDIQPGGLTSELQERLKASQHLVVICSPNSAKSEWVGKEIAFFHKLGRSNNIHLFIVSGSPNSNNPDTECFNPIFKKLNMEEILGANVNEKVFKWKWLNRERAYIQLISKLLNLEFDAIWQRQKRIYLCHTLAIGIISASIAIIMYWFAVPIKLYVDLHDAKHNLPPFEKGILRIAGNEYILHSIDTSIRIKPFPGYMRKHTIQYNIVADNRYEPIMSQIKLTSKISQHININMQRNKEFAVFSGQVLDNKSNPIPNVTIIIEDKRTTTNAQGNYYIEFPIESQTERKKIIAVHKNYCKRILDSAYVGNNSFIMKSN